MTEGERRLAARRELWSRAFSGIDLAGNAILDAGTGEGYFARFLAERRVPMPTGRLVSVTCLADEIPPAQAIVGDLADRVEFRVANLVKMPEIEDASFDIVAADYLLAAVAAYSPYQEIDCLKELKRVLRPGGRLVITGWETWRDCRNSTEALVRRLMKFREALNHLAGIDPFREYPQSWIESRLADLGMPAERTVQVPDIHRDLSWAERSCRRKLEDMPACELRTALENRLEEYMAPIRSSEAIAAGLEFGRHYAVVACKLDGAILL